MKIKLDGKWWEVIGTAEIYKKTALCPIQEKPNKKPVLWTEFTGPTFLEFTIRVGSRPPPFSRRLIDYNDRRKLCVYGLSFFVTKIRVAGSGRWRRANVFCQMLEK